MEHNPDTLLFQNSVQFLHNVINTCSLGPALTSYLSIKRTLLEIRSSSRLPYNISKPSTYCRRCLLEFPKEKCKIRLERPKKVRFAAQVAKKVELNKKLTKYQVNYYKKMKNKHKSVLKISCSNCIKITRIPLVKPIKPKKIVNNQPVSKKRKKKDAFCGLNQAAVLSANTTKQTKKKAKIVNNNSVQISHKLKFQPKGKKKINPVSIQQPKIQNKTISKAQKKKNEFKANANARIMNVLASSSSGNTAKSSLTSFLKSM